MCHCVCPCVQGLNSLRVMDRIVIECGRRGIKIILDYHRLHLTTSNELGTWWDERTPEEVWVRNWRNLAWRYRKNPTIIGVSTCTRTVLHACTHWCGTVYLQSPSTVFCRHVL